MNYKTLKISIRIRKSVKDRQNNDEKDKRTNNDKRNTKHKTKDRVTHTALKTNGEIKKGNSCSTRGTHRVTVGSSFGH